MNDSDRHIMSVFCEALEHSLPEEQAAYVNAVCGEDTDLRARVEALLKAHQQAGAFLGGNDSAPSLVSTIDEHLAAAPGMVIGPYKLLDKIGEGGFGVVFLAEQQQPVHRKVALKILKPGMDTRQVVARFEAERQALALMDHPNIARVLDGGEAAFGLPYFVMELVRGVSITDHCDQNNLPVRERLGLFIDVCQAVQHAHQKGIIHRDIKPSNVLVTLDDGRPMVKVIDFGVAKAMGQPLTDKTLFTGFAQMLGTPMYMSPEQAGMSGLDIDTRTDIYSLGVLLYELLTGLTPFDKERLRNLSYEELRHILREEEPPKPSLRLSTVARAATPESAPGKSDPRKLGDLIRGELDWIVMKALEKDRNRRYESPSAFAADVQRYLRDEPVQACPPSGLYRFRKFARRNKRVLATAAMLGVIVLLVLVGGPIATAVVWRLWSRADEAHGKEVIQRELAEEQRGIAQQKTVEAQEAAAVAEAVNRFLVDDLFGAAAPERTLGRPVTVAETLAQAEQHIGTAFKDQPLVEAAVRHAMGTTYLQLGQFGPAERHFARARDLRARILGEEQANTLRSAQHLALVYCFKGRREEAEKLTEETLAIRRRVLGVEHPDTLNSMVSLVIVLQDRGKREEARTLIEETLMLEKRVLGADHPSTLGSMLELANVLHQQGKPKEALELREELFTLEKRILGEEHPETITCMNNKANSLWEIGRWEEARELHGEALKLRMRVLGPDHPDTLASMFNLSGVLKEQGKLADVRKLLDEAMPRQARVLGEEHPDVFRAQNFLGNLLREEGKAEEARALLEKTVALQTRFQGAAHPETLRTMHNLALVLKDQGKLLEARRLTEETLALATRTLGAEHPDTLKATNSLANVLWAQGDREQARKLLEENLAVRKRILGLEHPLTLRSMSNLADKLWTLDKVAEARKLLDAALPLQTRLLGAEHHDTLNSMTNLANVLCKQGKVEEGRKLHEEVLAVRRRVLGPEHPDTLRATHNVASSLTMLNKLEEGRKLHEENLLVLKRVRGPEHPDTLESMFCVANGLFAQGKLEEGRKLYEETLELQTRIVGEDNPSTLDSMNNLIVLLQKLAFQLEDGKRYEEAEQSHRRAVALLEKLVAHFRESASHRKALAGGQSKLALFLVLCPEPKFHKPEEAIKLAGKAIELAPEDRAGWIVLAMGQYRAGNWKAVVNILDQSRRRFQAANHAESFIAAMANWQLGRKEEARALFDQADEWMRKNARQYRDLQALRAEAAELLGVKGEQAPNERSK